MKKYLLFCLVLIAQSSYSQSQSGFFNFNWDDDTGKVNLEIPKNRIGERFLYVNSLAAGVGSNDIGLDRGQLGGERVVYFYKSGNKILLVQDNLKYRAVSDNEEEVKAVEEAFAKSVVWGFKIEDSSNGYTINLADFLMRDAHGVADRLSSKKQGAFKLDKSKSAIYKEQLLNFPDNSEFEAMVTFAGKAKGKHIRSVAANPDLVTVRMHHSFIRLPDSNYEPRVFMPESGYFMTSFYDYATPIDQDMVKRFITRHRLEKKYPARERSEAKEPIIYYLDRGCPEPVKSALLEGARWWNQAFEAAGFVDAFQVEVLPEGAHPLDVRYNMIQWVHRSTRGWSYGSSVKDPRTGEIIKGHVSLGSLRVRQDYMIAQGIVSSFDKKEDDPRMLEMALARLRQLSAHEVGHTIGLAHNFAASYNNRASVMDYPHPYIVEGAEAIDFKKAYDVGIGDWDKRAITYGYSYPTDDLNENDYLQSLINKNKADGFLYITDQDARPTGGLHAYAHLWDNGNDPVGELKRINVLRRHTLDKMGNGTIPVGTPYSELEKKLVPVYLMHRYQVDGVSKIIGGVDFEYAVKQSGKSPQPVKPLDAKMQTAALDALLETLDPEFLKIPESLLQMIPPPAFGYGRDRETFSGHMGSLFDPVSAAEASANHTLKFLLNPERLARISYQSSLAFTLEKYLNKISDKIFSSGKSTDIYNEMLQKIYFIHLLKLSKNPSISKAVNAQAFQEVQSIKLQHVSGIDKQMDTMGTGHAAYLFNLTTQYFNDPVEFQLPTIPDLPPGSPIGCH